MDFNFTKTNRLSVFEMIFGIDWALVKKLLDGWKDGTVGVLSIKKKGKPKSPEQLGYYYPVIIPAAIKGFIANEDFSLTLNFGDKKIEVELTEKNMDNFLKLRYAAMTGKYMDKTDMNMEACSAFEDICIKWIATWLKVQVPPADKNWRKKKENK